MKLGRKPNLGHIHEFGEAAYVKDLKAGKLNSRALVGQFVGYDIESKGYWIYWPTKRSITVERNIVINENNVHTAENLTIIQDDALSEGECQGTSLAVCTPLYTLFTVHISPSFYFAYIHLLLFGYHLNLSCSQ